MNKIHAWPAVVGTSLSLSILYILCAIFIWKAPVRAVSLFGTMFHGIDLTKITTTTITFSSFFTGLILTIILTVVFTFLAILFYNLCLRHCIRKKWIKEE